MSEHVRVQAISGAFKSTDLEVGLQQIEERGLRTLLTMNMFGYLGEGEWWIICREMPDHTPEREQEVKRAQAERAVQQRPG